MSIEPPSNFYVAGGTLRPGAPSYVERQADQELYDRALAGDFLYVLTSRQMGKSSLMARAAKRLKDEAGVHTAIVDLTSIGTEDDEGSTDKWYYGVATSILDGLGIRVNLDEWWDERAKLPALQRLTKFFSDIVLANTTEKVIIFVDEIDSTIKLPFADDFFAAIRACYNARATEAAYNRLSFVLLGVASPSDLIKDTARTPFNIGHRIDLTDFTFEEAKPLARGLGATDEHCEQALRRILHWTGGHPYLTQKICLAAASSSPFDGTSIDLLVEENFFSAAAKFNDFNLSFVRNWLTQDSENNQEVIETYRDIYEGKMVIDSPLSPIHSELKLSGAVTQRGERRLQIRNRIYQKVFSDKWAAEALLAIKERRIRKTSIERIGPYRLIRLIGRGGLSSVYLAERDDGLFRQIVAIKIASPEVNIPRSSDRFREEARLLAHLEHPNIIRYYDGGLLEDGRIYVVMEYVEGLPINTYCQENQLSIRERLKLFRTVCEAVGYLHKHCIVHRDLKPSNIVVNRQGVIKLLDFGLAKPVQSVEKTGAVYTPLYASPDQLTEIRVTAASDVYSLGVILYELLTDRLPYKSGQQTVIATALTILQGNILPPSLIILGLLAKENIDKRRAAALDQLILKALNKSPTERYPTAIEFAEAIQHYLSKYFTEPQEAAVQQSQGGKFVSRLLDVIRKFRQ